MVGEKTSGFLIVNQPDATFSQIYFGRKLYISKSSSVHHQEFFVVHTAMVYVIHVFLTAVRKTCMTYTIAV